MKKMLELGVGDNPRPAPDYEYIGLDCSQNSSADVICKAGFEPLPFPDNEFDRILGDQFLEHVPRIGYRLHHGGTFLVEFNPVIELLNEVCRVSKHTADVQFNVPKWNSKEFAQDPTHVNPVPKEFWIYWDPRDEWDLKRHYGIKGSLQLRNHQDCGWYDIFHLKVIK